MDGSGDGVNKSLVAVGSKIDSDFCARSNGPGHLNIQFDLGVGAAGIARRIRRAIYGNSSYCGSVQAESLEIRLQVAVCIAAAEFKNTDGLACAVQIGREAVKLRHLRRGQRLRSGLSACVQFPKMWLSDGTRVEAEHRFNDSRYIFRKSNGPFKAMEPLLVFVTFIIMQGHAKGLFHVGGRAAQHN